MRGFTRNVKGNKHYIDHRIFSIQQCIDKMILDLYQTVNINIYQENLFHTKMLLKDFNLDNYLFAAASSDFTEEERTRIKKSLKQEMTEIFYSKNIF